MVGTGEIIKRIGNFPRKSNIEIWPTGEAEEVEKTIKNLGEFDVKNFIFLGVGGYYYAPQRKFIKKNSFEDNVIFTHFRSYEFPKFCGKEIKIDEEEKEILEKILEKEGKAVMFVDVVGEMLVGTSFVKERNLNRILFKIPPSEGMPDFIVFESEIITRIPNINVEYSCDAAMLFTFDKEFYYSKLKSPKEKKRCFYKCFEKLFSPSKELLKKENSLCIYDWHDVELIKRYCKNCTFDEILEGIKRNFEEYFLYFEGVNTIISSFKLEFI